MRRERDALLAVSDASFIVKTHFIFQDSLFIHFVMDFLPGGNLGFRMQKKKVASEHK